MTEALQTEFREDADEPSVNTSTRWPMLIGMAIFLFLFAGVGTWLYMAQIAGAVIASGAVSVQGKPKTIQHLDGGIVTDIPVENGDMVEQGDLLLRFDDTVLLSNLDIYENRLREAVARLNRLRSERDGRSRVLTDNSILGGLSVDPDSQILKGQRDLFQARRSTRSGQISQLEEKIFQFGNQTRGLNDIIRSKREQMRLLEQEYSGLSELARQGYAAANRPLALQRQIEDIRGQIAEHQAEIARIENSVTEIRIQMMQIGREFDESVLTELRETESAVNDLRQQITATRDQLSRVDVIAPVSGVVHQLNIFTIGGVVGPGGVVMQIVPQSEDMEIEVNVEPIYVDQVYIGQSAAVVFSAFNARTTPQLEGQVIAVSPDSVVNEETGAAFYKVKVAVDEVEMERLNDLKLVPGMPVEVFLTTQNQSPLEYLTRPLTDNMKRAMREE